MFDKSLELLMADKPSEPDTGLETSEGLPDEAVSSLARDFHSALKEETPEQLSRVLRSLLRMARS